MVYKHMRVSHRSNAEVQPRLPIFRMGWNPLETLLNILSAPLYLLASASYFESSAFSNIQSIRQLYYSSYIFIFWV